MNKEKPPSKGKSHCHRPANAPTTSTCKASQKVIMVLVVEVWRWISNLVASFPYFPQQESEFCSKPHPGARDHNSALGTSGYSFRAAGFLQTLYHNFRIIHSLRRTAVQQIYFRSAAVISMTKKYQGSPFGCPIRDLTLQKVVFLSSQKKH